MNRRAASAALLPILAVALSGCASGRHNAQYGEVSAINGTNASTGGLGIRNAFFTTPAAAGGTAVLEFSVYADDPDAATTLTSVTSTALAGEAPAKLATVKNGVQQEAAAVPVNYQAGPGANIITASFPSIQTNAEPAAFYPVVFAFANGLTQRLDVAVAQVGTVDPTSTLAPTAFPEEPFPLTTALPGEGTS